MKGLTENTPVVPKVDILSSGVLSPEQELLLLEQAVARGWLSRDCLSSHLSAAGIAEAVPGASSLRWGPRIDPLAAQGVLDAATIYRLIRQCLPDHADSDPGSQYETVDSRPPAMMGLSPPDSAAAEALPAFLRGGERYEVLRQLGQGGMGTIYEARDRSLGRLVALKFLRRDRAGAASRLLQEARTQSRIDHPHVCKVHEVGEFAGQPTWLKVCEGTCGPAVQAPQEDVPSVVFVDEVVHSRSAGNPGSNRLRISPQWHRQPICLGRGAQRRPGTH